MSDIDDDSSNDNYGDCGGGDDMGLPDNRFTEARVRALSSTAKSPRDDIRRSALEEAAKAIAADRPSGWSNTMAAGARLQRHRAVRIVRDLMASPTSPPREAPASEGEGESCSKPSLLPQAGEAPERADSVLLAWCRVDKMACASSECKFRCAKDDKETRPAIDVSVHEAPDQEEAP